MRFLDELAARRRFGMKPGLETMRAVCSALGNPERRLSNVIHVAGTNGKGATCAILDACLRAAGHTVARYTSPHLVKLNERFFLNGEPIPDSQLVAASNRLFDYSIIRLFPDLTFFEALTAVAFVAYAEADPDYTVLETGLGGRLDATNVCRPCLTIITRIGLDHCDWLGDTVEKIAAEKAGIIKPGVPIVLGRNVESVREVVRARADALGAPFHYAPDLASEAEIPAGFSLAGAFNRENAVTALAALKVRGGAVRAARGPYQGFDRVVWPGRFQRVGNFIVDGAHNPPAATALAAALSELGFGPRPSSFDHFDDSKIRRLVLICGFCGDKDIDATLRILKPFVARALAVKTNNPRSLTAEELVAHLQAVGIPVQPCATLDEAIRQSAAATEWPPYQAPEPSTFNLRPSTLICGSLFLAGEALVALGAYPYVADRFDAAELLAGGSDV